MYSVGTELVVVDRVSVSGVGGLGLFVNELGGEVRAT